MNKISPCLCFNGEAEAAAELYTSLFSDSSIDSISRYGEGMHLPAGTAMLVEFSLAGQRFQALNGGADFPHSEAISFSISCHDQAEIDYFWNGFIADGGVPGQCGWLKDRFGVSWQIVPVVLGQLMAGADSAGTARVMQALLQMTKLDIAGLEAAYAGETL